MKKYIFIFVFLLSAPLFAGQSLPLTDKVEKESLSPYLSFYEDTSAGMTFEKVMTSDVQSNFKDNTATYPAFGFTKSALWGKVIIDNKSGAEQNWFLVFDFPHLEELTVYVKDGDNKYRKIEVGKNIPFQDKPVKHRKPIVPLKGLAKGESAVYFRVATSEGMELPVSILNDESLARSNYLEMFVSGLYYGIVIIMFFYNLFIFFSLKDRSYFYYVLYIGFYGIAQMLLDGYDIEMVDYDVYNITRDSRVWLASIGIICSILFATHYLNLKNEKPRLYKSFKWIIGAVCLPIPLLFIFGFYYAVQLSLVYMILSAIFMITIGFMTAKTSEYARFFLSAWLIFLIGVIIFGAKAANVFIPFLTPYAMQIGNVLEITLLSFGLAHRIRVLQKEKELVTETFGKVVDPAIRDYLLKGNIDIGGQEAIATILFTDIRKFTELSEKLQPKEVVGQLNRYLESMSNEVSIRHGLVNKYIGDAIMAIYNVPLVTQNHCSNAIQTAISMQKSLRSLNQNFSDEGLVPLQSGVGIHTGSVLSGNIGSSVRMEYTVIGDSVNVASRIEGLTKYYHTPILASGQVIDSSSNIDDFYWREIDNVNLQGKQESVKLYEIFNCDPDELIQKKISLGDRFMQARALYTEGKFKQALAEFEAILKDSPQDQVAKVMADRCKIFITHPPAGDWNGIITFDFK